MLVLGLELCDGLRLRRQRGQAALGDVVGRGTFVDKVLASDLGPF